MLRRLLHSFLRDSDFNHRWKLLAKRFLPRWLQLEIRKRVLTASLRNDAVPLELDATGLRLLLRPGDFAVDVGANVGTYTKVLSSLVGPSGRVWAFEPVPENHAVLAFASRRLRLSNVTLYECALSDASGTGLMEIPVFSKLGESLYDARLVHTPGSRLRTIEVRLATLDSLLSGVDRGPSFIKIDVEGHELQCLEGAMETLRAYKPSLMIETFEDPAREGSLANHVVRLLSNASYAGAVFNGSGFTEWDGTTHPQNLFFFPPNSPYLATRNTAP